jgi:hypothetical protein
MRTGKTSNRPNLRSWHIGATGDRLEFERPRLDSLRLAALGLALLSAIASMGVAAAQPPPAETPFPPGSIGVVGCSNTSEHVDGYSMQSELGQLTQPRLGGLSFEMWGDPATRDFDAAWRKYDSARPAGGYAAAWVQMCIRADDEHDPNALLSEVVSQIRQRDPDIPIYVSPINDYEEGHVCGRIGPDGFAVGEAAVEWGVANLGVVAGPVTGPLTVDMLAGDGCHLGPSGLDLVGSQLVTWFDAGASPSGTDPLAVAFLPLCTVLDPLVSLGAIAPIPLCAPR